MRAAAAFIGAGSRTLSYFLGTLVLALAVAAIMTSLEAADIAAWAWRAFGMTFLALFASLVFVALFSWTRMRQVADAPGTRLVWLETGMHAANGVATLALTYTLLGISLGIGQLADQELTPATVQGVIRGLTEQFSLAFLTTIVGLPTAAALRALIRVTSVRLASRHMPAGILIEGDES